MAKTNKEKQADFRKNRKEQGLILFRAWIRPEWAVKIKEFIEKLEKK